MRIAVIGSGISGLGSAWLLGRAHQVTLFESNDYLGGHTHTHRVSVDGRDLAVDTGFIVFNPRHYPLFTRLLAQLEVGSQETTMSFSVRNERSGLEYGATSLDALFCQRRNALSPRFLGMLRDLVRFYRQAPALLRDAGPGPTLGEYLAQGRYGAAFRDDHLVPMAAALWSAPPAQTLAFPARFIVQFMANHNMLQLTNRPPWRVVLGGSASYIKALQSRWRVFTRLSCRVHQVQRDDTGVTVASDAGRERFDRVVLACHSDQALALLEDADAAERAVLGAIRYQPNEVILHTDGSFLPRNRKAWSAWNAQVPLEADRPATLSYCMNLLQGIECPTPLVVTLNPSRCVPEAAVLRRLRYTHPVFTPDAVAAQARRPQIQGRRHTYFAGAYWGFGFHEDGLRSAVEVAGLLGVPWGDDV